MMKRIICAVLTLSCCILAVAPAFAGTPEFGRSQEEWTGLRDNVLEYGEIDALIKEYNPTVKSNALDLREFRKNYGTTNTEVSEKYADLAAELDGGVDLDETSPTYAMSAMTAAVNSSTARQLQAMADSSLEDYEVNRLGYEQQEKTLAQKAKSDFIAYYNNQLEAERARLNVELLQTQLEIKKTQADTGQATQVDVLKATEELLNAQKTHTQAAAAVETVKKKLQVACGWKYDEEPEFGSLPKQDQAVIDSLNPTMDLQAATDNNYTLRINERKLSNARAESTKETLTTAVAGNKQNIALSLQTAYLNATAARDAYEYAKLANSVQQQTLEQMKKKHESGSAGDFDLKAQEITSRITEIAVQQAENAMLEAVMNYQSAVNGLAGA